MMLIKPLIFWRTCSVPSLSWSASSSSVSLIPAPFKADRPLTRPVAFLNESFVTTLATAGTALLSLSFIFSATAAEILGSCIFLFVKHPFDVGDRVDINDEAMVVERISLLYTVFKGVATHRTRQAPNSVLNGLWIDNVSRSKSMRERLQVYISFDTTLDDVQLLKKEMQNFVRDRENSRDFEPEIDVEVTGVSKMDNMELTIEIRHKVSKIQAATSCLGADSRSPTGPMKPSALLVVPSSCAP